MPHSIEAEEYLLSLCLLDGTEMVDRCLDMKIGGADFYLDAHRVVYGCIVDLYHRKKPIDASVVAEELKAEGRLDGMGGYAFITQVSSLISTTANAGYYLEKVKELALLRDIIRSATGAVEDCYNFSGNIDEFAGQIRDRIEQVTSGAATAEQQLNDCAFNPNEAICEDRVVYRLGDTPICTAGNLMAMVAPPGVGKSAVFGAMLAAAMCTPSDGVDCLGFSGPNYAKLPLLHFDTEQSKGDYQKLLHRSLKRSGQTEFPDWFHSYHFTGKTAQECRHLVEVAIAKFARKHEGKLFGVIIDGWGDLVANPNDEGECFPFIARMMMLAIKHDAPIMGVLHLNPGSEGKSRGHLGSQLERKCATVLQLSMDAEMVTTVWATKKRGAPIRKENGPRFRWSDDKLMHVSLPSAAEMGMTKQQRKEASKFAEAFSREEQVSFYPTASAPHEARGVIFRKAAEASHISARQLDRLRQDFLKAGWIRKDDDGLYYRTRDGDDRAARINQLPIEQQIEF